MSLAARSARNFSIQIATFAVTIFDRVVLTALLIRVWGVETFSDWATLLAAVGMIGVADLGFQTYLGTMLARAQTRERMRAFGRLVRLGLFFYSVLGFVLIAGAVSVAAFADLRELLRLHGNELTGVFLCLAAAQILRTSRSGVTQIFRGMGEYHRFTLTDLRAAAVSAVASAAAVLAAASPLVVALVYLGAELALGVGMAILQVRRDYPAVALRWERPTRARAARTARTLTWYGTFQVLVNGSVHFPVLIIAGLGLSGPILAMFVVLRTLVNVARTIGTNLCTAVGVELAPGIDSRTAGNREHGLIALARLNSAVSAVIAAGLLVFCDQIVAAWTGQPRLGSEVLLALLLLPMVAIAPATPLQMVAVYSDRVKPQAIASAIQSAIAIPCAILLGMHVGIVGVAAALAVGEIVGIAIAAPLLTARTLHISYGRVVGAGAWAFGLCFLWAAAVAQLARYAIALEGAMGLAARLALWSALGAGPAMWLALPPGLRNRVAGLMRR